MRPECAEIGPKCLTGMALDSTIKKIIELSQTKDEKDSQRIRASPNQIRRKEALGMTLFSYEIFDAVARQGSFNKAAQQLHLTPSAISHAIAVMEEELGFALFNRGKNGVSMTSYGASLYPSIRDVLNSDEALKQSIARLNGLEKGKVKLGVFNSVCASLLPGLLKSFMAHYPQIEIEVYQGTYDDVKEWLRTGQVDIAFLSSTCKEEFNLTELFREPLLCIVPQDWPEPENGVMTPALMNGQSFVVQCDATDAEMRQFLKKYKIGTERRCHVIDDQSNIAMVEAGLGISIMPQMLLRDCKAAVKIYPIEPEEYRVVGLAVQRPAAMAPAVEQMFHHIVDYCKQIELQ